jgi:hypothetical protein
MGVVGAGLVVVSGVVAWTARSGEVPVVPAVEPVKQTPVVAVQATPAPPPSVELDAGVEAVIDAGVAPLRKRLPAKTTVQLPPKSGAPALLPAEGL